MAELAPIASLWIGGALSWLEQLCLKSFADAGHPTTLYSYAPIPNIPEGVQSADAEEIFPAKPMLRHARTGSPAIHADLWRLHLLTKTNAIWVDADMYCYRPFEFETPFVFGWEKNELVCNAVLGLPQDSATLGNLLDFLSDPYAIAPWLKPWQKKELEEEAAAGRPVHLTEQNWGFTGPAAVSHFLKATGEIRHAQNVDVFYPISFKDRNHMIRRRFNIPERLTDATRGVHFWARRMKPRLEEKENNVPMNGSFLKSLIDKHEIDPALAPIPAKVKTSQPTGDALIAAIISDLREKGHSIDRVCRTHLVEKAFVKDCLKRNSPKISPAAAIPVDRIRANYNHDRHFLQTVHAARKGTAKRPFLYMKNHKSACTTVLATLLKCQQMHLGDPDIPIEESTVHKPPARYMSNGRRNLDVDQAIEALFDPRYLRFTIIREPISRTVSAYADKISSGGKQKTALLKTVGKQPDDDISLSQFIDLIANDEAAMNVDRHWRLQSKEISYGFIDYDLIGTVSNVSSILARVADECFGLEAPPLQDTRTTFGHQTSSKDLIETLTADDLRNLDRVLEADLEMYEAVSKAEKPNPQASY